MDYDKLNIFEQILIPVPVLAPMVLWYISSTFYQKYYIAKINANEKVSNETFGDQGGGQMTADGFSMRPPLPLEDFSSDENVQFFVKKYNKACKIFWLWSIFGTAIIIIGLNLIEHYSLLK